MGFGAGRNQCGWLTACGYYHTWILLQAGPEPTPMVTTAGRDWCVETLDVHT